MSIDHFYTRTDNKFVRLEWAVVNENRTAYWVDICHNWPMIDERYYFSDWSSALKFYLEGWKERQYLDDKNQLTGLDHSGIYAHGHLIYGHSIYLDLPGHEGEGLRKLVEAFAMKLSEEKKA